MLYYYQIRVICEIWLKLLRFIILYQKQTFFIPPKIDDFLKNIAFSPQKCLNL